MESMGANMGLSPNSQFYAFSPPAPRGNWGAAEAREEGELESTVSSVLAHMPGLRPARAAQGPSGKLDLKADNF